MEVGAFNNTVVVEPAQRQCRRTVFRAFLQANGVALHQGCAVNQVFPIGGLWQYVGTVEVLIGLQLCCCTVAVHRRVGGCAVVRIFISRPVHIAPLICIEQIQTALVGLQRESGIECDVCFALLGALGGDDYNTVGCLGTVD